MATALAIASSTSSFSSVPNIATLISCSSNSNLSLRTRTYPSLPSTSLIIIPSKKLIFFNNPSNLIISPTLKPINNRVIGPIPVAAEDIITSEGEVVDATQQLVSNTGDDGVSTVISSLLFAAFIGLSILTIGVIYLGVTDFLQKREKEKFEKEEAAKDKSGKKKKKKVVRARAGPRGFGQKIDEEEDDD
ncbi:hypothetical protein RIF29_27820 [Crotalaria pallida]|uniref:Transmembrane protein n=1 Tax=Crotalaria pallida TaxID=3830 RepID=A0AAN9I5Z0_CROPI